MSLAKFRKITKGYVKPRENKDGKKEVSPPKEDNKSNG